MSLVRSGATRLAAPTLGRDGALLASADGVLRMPAMDVPMQSSVGAGDASLGATVLALARGASKREGLRRGTAAGATVIASAGGRRGGGGRMWSGAIAS
jgi:6-phosphofructokinase 2